MTRSIVMFHEIGHHLQHREQVIVLEDSMSLLFSICMIISEYEANMFAAQISFAG